MPQLMTSWGLLYRAMRAAFPAEDYVAEGDALTFVQKYEKKGDMPSREERRG